MPLREIGAYFEWIERETPSRRARSVARTFIAELGDEPWRAPSVPIGELSNQPEYEVRTALLTDDGGLQVQVWYLESWRHGFG